MEGPGEYWRNLLAQLPPTVTSDGEAWARENILRVCYALLSNPITNQQLEIAAAANTVAHLTGRRTAVCFTLTMAQCQDFQRLCTMDTNGHICVGNENDFITEADLAGDETARKTPYLLAIKVQIIISANRKAFAACIFGRKAGRFRICNSCSKIGELYPKCSRCQAIHYCSGECQKKDWPAHKPECKPE